MSPRSSLQVPSRDGDAYVPGTQPTLGDRLRSGDHLLGTFVKSSDPAMAEILAMAGFDYLIADLEHSSLSLDKVESIVRAAAIHDVPVIVRIPSESLHEAGRALDGGARGIQVSDLTDAATARRARRLCSYPPAGTRSMSLSNRAAGFGRVTAEEHLARSERDLVLVGQVESVAGTAALPRMLADDLQVDVWFLGSLDLSMSLGHPGSTTDGKVAAVLVNAAEAIHAANALFGVFVPTVDEAQRWIARGASMVAISSDYGLLSSTALGQVREWRAFETELRARTTMAALESLEEVAEPTN
jgi:4-hydroxy-2-oxoheptanedioate aldolase